MATNEIAEWSKTDAANNFTPLEGGWPEGMPRSDVNTAGRADMGALRRWYDAPEWLDLTVGASLAKTSATVLSVLGGDFTAYFTDGRRVKITETSGGPTYATVDGTSTFGGGNTSVTLRSFTGATEIPADLLLVFVHIVSVLSDGPYLPDQLVRVTTLTDVGLQAAIDTLEAAQGGIIVLEPNATYVIDATVVIGDGTNPGNIRIIGRGATLQAGTNLDDEILDIRDTTPGVISAKVVIEDVIFDGDSAGETGTTGVGLVNIGEDTSFVAIRDCLFDDSWAHGLTIKTSSNSIWIEGCTFRDNGEDGINIEDSDADLDRVYIRACTFDNPSARSGFTTGSGINFAGNVTISDCQFINLDHGGDVQVGITCAQKDAASPTDHSAHQSVIHGCAFSGTGLNARGIWLRGRENIVSSCSFRLSGTGSEAIQIDDAGGTEESNMHVISACNIFDAQFGVNIESTAEDVVVTGCKFSDCPFPYRDNGTRNKFSSNHITTCTDGVTLLASAIDPVVSDNTIDTASSEGISITSGATRSQLYLNYITNATTAAITDSGNSTAIASTEHLYHAVSKVGSGDAVALVLDEPNVEYAFDETAVAFSDFADGSLAWTVKDLFIEFGLTASGTEQDFTLRLRVGTNRTGTITLDDVIASEAISSGSYSAPTDITADFGHAGNLQFQSFVPSLNDEIYLTAERTSGLSVSDVTLTLKEAAVTAGMQEGCFFQCEIRPRDFV